MFVVLGILIPSATFLAWKKFSGELPSSSFVTIPANQASMLSALDWPLLSECREFQRLNFMFKASQNLNDIGLTKLSVPFSLPHYTLTRHEI